MTLEALAEIVAKGFGQMATKDDLSAVKTDLIKRMATKDDLEDLAIMTARGFGDVSGRLNKLKDSVVGLKEEMKKGFDHLENRIDGVEFKLSSNASAWTKDSDHLHEWVGELDKRVNKIEDKIVSAK